ncbi:MAG: hypothetical protein M1821_008054 [Bathelium mastoideum]|nr:MAG: hypothetical protein M1821_008054 [Bathelium mastoideum]
MLGCRKGNRDCVYPSKTKTQKVARGSIKSKSATRDSESASDAYESEEKDQLQTVPDQDDDTDLASVSSATITSKQSRLETSPRETSDPLSLSLNTSPSLSTEGSLSTVHDSPRSSKGGARLRRAKDVESVNQRLSIPSNELTFLLDFYRKNITCYHYGWRLDEGGFLHGEFLDMASNYEPLLYAVAGFAAYHYTLRHANGKLSDFLQLYNNSVSLLRISLRETEKHTEATLLTILQLATFEEYLGDWLNLIGHQRAALTILKTFYTPESIQETPTLRKILMWYYQFDLTVGFLSGNGVILEKEWIARCHERSLREKQANPSNVALTIEEYMNHHRLLATDLAILIAKRTRAKKGLVCQSEQEFWTECNSLAQRIAHFENYRDPALNDSGKEEYDFSGWRPRPSNDIVDPTRQRPFYTGELFPMNFALIDLCAIKVMFQYKLVQLEGKPQSADCTKEAFKAAQMFEAIQLCPDSRPGALLAMHHSLAMTCLFLPRDERTTMWLRRKFVSVEANGYIFPSAFRRRMSRLWGVDVRDWWLPNDEGFQPILRAARDFVQARMGPPRDQFSQDLQNINGIFSSFNIEESDYIGDEAFDSDGSPTTVREGLGVPDQASTEHMLLDDQTTTGDSSPPRFLQQAARAQHGWTW